ncbi:MAG: trypsin-like peptidase domain-containing protein [Clostridia bacterium]|nr:trypsin-like peptidase domain-containing protein [Clostridia bacterium]
MNENFTPENIGENHIREIKEEKRKPKTRFPFAAFIITLIVCIIVSAVSGAGGAFFMFTLLSPAPTPTESTTKEEFVIEENTTAASLNIENTIEEQTSSESNTFVPVTPEVQVSEEITTQPEATTAPALSKGDIYAEAVNSIVAIKSSWKQYYNSLFGSYYRPATSTGTGFAVTENGYIVTNCHVVEKAEELTVTDYNGKQYSAKVIGTVPSNDFAVIKIDAVTSPVNLGNSSSLKVGDDIMVIGNALGELSYTFTDGIISHLSRLITLENGETINMFQTNAAINNGNSGGPVYNTDGVVVGIASAKYASENVEGLSFCIPIDDVKNMMADIIFFGYVTGKPYLGVSLQTVTSSMSSRYSLPTGCYVVALDNSGVCYEAGLRTGDVIVKLGEKTVSSCESVEKILADKKAGSNISMTYYRNGENITVNFSLGEAKPSEPRTDYSNVFDY